MFGHLISKQAQVIGGGAMPSGTLESTLNHISSESSCKQINPARGSQEREFRKLLCSDVYIYFRPVHAHAAIPELFSFQFEIVIAPPIC